MPNPNIPSRPTSAYSSYSFPSDLTAKDRNFYTQMQFVQYQPGYLSGTETLSTKTVPTGGIRLPLPRKINEQQTINWEQVSATQIASQIINNTAGSVPAIGSVLSGAVQAAGQVGQAVAGAAGGVTFNPYLWMLFKNPNFKQHQLSWVLTPNNEKESRTLASIIKYCKFSSLPEQNGPLYKYPNILLIKFYPESQYTFNFKPCAVTSVSVDYSGGGGPSFFNNGAPTVINLTLGLQEIDLWTQNNYV